MLLRVTSLPPVKQLKLSHELHSPRVQDFSIVKEETAGDGRKVFQVKWPDDKGSGSSQGGSSDTPDHHTGASQPTQPLRAHPAAIRSGARQDVFVSMLLLHFTPLLHKLLLGSCDGGGILGSPP